MTKVSGGGSRMTFGAILVIVGIMLMLSQLGIIEFGRLMGLFWPVILIVVGLWQWGKRHFRFTIWPILLTAFGVFFLLLNLDLLDGRMFGVVVGAALIAFGVWMVVRKARPQVQQAVSTSDVIDHWIVFGGVEEELTTQQFSGGTVTAVFGGADLDLRRASLAPGTVRMTVTAIFGGVDIRVPPEWDVFVDSTAILGGVEDKTATETKHESSATTEPTSRLHIDATAVFGGVEVKH
ncbi:MAG: DUF5668 domain-containing protein [Candidatus Zixiibacteriota bacterium]